MKRLYLFLTLPCFILLSTCDSGDFCPEEGKRTVYVYHSRYSSLLNGRNPNAYSSINEAISNSIDGVKICVFPGLYEERISLDKNLHLIGAGEGKTFIVNHEERATITIKEGVTSEPTIEGFTIYGGGDIISLEDGAVAEVVRCTIKGGKNGIFLSSGAQITLRENIVSGNQVNGISSIGENILTLEENLFQMNGDESVFEDGSFSSAINLSYPAYADITLNTFTDNISSDTGDIYIDGATLVSMESNLFSLPEQNPLPKFRVKIIDSNVQFKANRLFIDGETVGLYIENRSGVEKNTTIITALFADESLDKRGYLIYLENLPSFYLINSTIASPYSFAQGGGGLLISNIDSGFISNTVIWGNGNDIITMGEIGNLYVSYSFLENEIDETWDSGNNHIGEDPIFKGQGEDAWRPYPLTSPLIDAGTNSPPIIDDEDIEGILRPQDGDNDGIPVFDVGAYENIYSD